MSLATLCKKDNRVMFHLETILPEQLCIRRISRQPTETDEPLFTLSSFSLHLHLFSGHRVGPTSLLPPQLVPQPVCHHGDSGRRFPWRHYVCTLTLTSLISAVCPSTLDLLNASCCPFHGKRITAETVGVVEWQAAGVRISLPRKTVIHWRKHGNFHIAHTQLYSN